MMAPEESPPADAGKTESEAEAEPARSAGQGESTAELSPRKAEAAPSSEAAPPGEAKPVEPGGFWEAFSAQVEQLQSRRRALWWFGWGSIAGFLGGFGALSVRFFFPRVLFEPPTNFKAGVPGDYTVGAVNTNFQKSQRVWIVREPEGFYALLAKCTHLGCTPVWKEAENKFKCPCHGSGFTKEGINYEGPAPRPLERLSISLAPDGQIVIDKGIKFRYERGEWDKPGALLRA